MIISRRVLLGSALATVSTIASPAVAGIDQVQNVKTELSKTGLSKNERLVALYQTAFSMKGLSGTDNEQLLADSLAAIYDFALTEYPAPVAGKVDDTGSPTTAFHAIIADAISSGEQFSVSEDVNRWPEEFVPYVVVKHLSLNLDHRKRIFLKGSYPSVKEKEQEILNRDA